MSNHPPPPHRRQLTEMEAHSLREYVTAMVLNGQITADAAGLHPIDLYVLNLLDIAGQVTPGELAERTALTTGAVTKLVDRLAGAGLVRRVADPSDRRRVLLRVGAEAAEAIGERAALFTPVATRMEALIANFPDEQRAVLFEYFARATVELQHATDELQVLSRTRRQRARRASGEARA